MARYNHARSRDDLIDGVTDLVASQIMLPSQAVGMAAAARRACRAAGGVPRAPAAATLLQQTRALIPALLALIEIALGALDEAGVSPSLARAAWAALVGLTYGHVAYQLAGHMSGAASGTAAVDAGAFPHVAAMASIPAFNWECAFGRALDGVIDGFIAAADR